MKKFALMLASASLLVTPCVGQLTAVSAQEIQESNIEEIEEPTGQYQVDISYPLEVNDEDFDQSLVGNQLNRFTAYQGQGYIWIKSESANNSQIFINNQLINIQEDHSDWQKVDISQLTIDGDNTIQINRLNATNSKLQVKIPYPILEDGTQAHQGNDSFKLIDQMIQAEIDHGFTSAQLVITHNGEIIKQSAYGLVNSYSPQGEKLTTGTQVTNETLYDLASNTKMYATNYALQKLVTDGELTVEQKVSEILPSFKDDPRDAIKGKDELTIRDLLEHQAGFPADPQYHNNNYDKHAEDGIGENSNPLYTQDRQEILEKITKNPLAYTPGTQTIYSDVDYMLLGLIIEEVTGQGLDDFMNQAFYQPLGLDYITFNPLDHGFTKDDVAATELNGNTRAGVIDFNNIRTDTIQGEVHDEKAYYTMDGVSGHAGLFSNATDLATLTQIMINGGGYGEQAFFSPEVIDEFIKPKSSDSSYGLGWRRQGDNEYAWAFSPMASNSTIGHTGWTGTLTVIDKENHFSLILLTNKKNSPVIDPLENPNDFVGDYFLTSRFGMIATLAMDGVQADSAQANDGKLIDMFIQKYEQITSQKEEVTDSDKASLEALRDVLLERKKGSATIRNFVEPSIYQEIDGFLDDTVTEE